jgi:hypothetical protein
VVTGGTAAAIGTQWTNQISLSFGQTRYVEMAFVVVVVAAAAAAAFAARMYSSFICACVSCNGALYNVHYQ